MPDRRNEDRARELAGEQDAEQRRQAALDAVRGVVREEMERAAAEAVAPQRGTAAAAATAQAADAPATEREAPTAELSAYERAVEQIARATGGRMGDVYAYPQRYQPGARNMPLNVTRGGIIDRLIHGDAGPAIRTIRFFQALADNDRAGMRQYGSQRALSSQVMNQGGALVPDEFAQEVITKLGELTPLATREFLRVVPMSRDTLSMPRLTALPDAAYASGENTDITTPDADQPEWGDVELVARDAVMLVPMPENLLADATVDLISYLIDLFADALARLRNKKLLLGNGATEPEGVAQNAAVIARGTTYDGTTAKTMHESVVGAFHDVAPAYRNGAIWIMSDNALEILSKVVDTQNRPILTQLLDEPFMRLRGKPVFITEALGTASTHAVFGNWKFYLFGDRQAMTAKTDAGGEYFKKRQIAVRVIERYAGRIAQEEAFTLLKTIA